MTRTLKTALVFLALAAAAPAVTAQDRTPRAGAPVAAVVVTETAPVVRRPRSGAPVVVTAPTSTELAGTVLVGSSDASTDLGLCGRKYCGSAYAR